MEEPPKQGHAAAWRDEAQRWAALLMAVRAHGPMAWVQGCQLVVIQWTPAVAAVAWGG